MPSSGVQTCRSEEHTSELQSHSHLVCRLLLEKKKRAIHRSKRSSRACASSSTRSTSIAPLSTEESACASSSTRSTSIPTTAASLFFFNNRATTEISPLSLHGAFPI